MAIVLVHGAWGGSWCWERVVPLLAERGLDPVAVDLPSVGASPDYTGGLEDDADVVRAALDSRPGPHVLCGHSYGGMVITAAGAGRSDVARLVYVCAFMPAEGESLFQLTGGKPAPWILQLDDGGTLMDPEYARSTGYSDCDDETTEAAIARLRPQRATPFGDPIATPGWREIPATYVVCARDASLPPEVQRDVFAPRATDSVELDASHYPYYSMPDRIADVLAAS